MGARGGQGVPDCLAARGVWECTSSVKGMAVKAAKLAQGYKNYAAPPSCGRASAWNVLPEALDLDRGLPPAKTHLKTINMVIFSHYSSLSAVARKMPCKNTHTRRGCCAWCALSIAVQTLNGAIWGAVGRVVLALPLCSPIICVNFHKNVGRGQGIPTATPFYAASCTPAALIPGTKPWAQHPGPALGVRVV